MVEEQSERLGMNYRNCLIKSKIKFKDYSVNYYIALKWLYFHCFMEYTTRHCFSEKY